MRFAAVGESLAHVVAPAVARLAVEIPGLEVSVHEAANASDAIDLVRGGRADIAVTTDVTAAGGRRSTPRRRGLRGTFLFAEEVVAHLAGLVGASVKVTLEIEANVPEGAPDNVVRTVTENSRTLKFSAHGFEKE